MSKTYLILLEEDDLCQNLDGLKAWEDSWRKTADYFRSGHNPAVSFAIEDCNDEHGAGRIAEFSSRIIENTEE